MDIFAGNVTFKNTVSLQELDLDIIPAGEKTFFIMWADEDIKYSSDVVWYLEKNIGEIAFHDISIESEDTLEILSSEYEEWVYECVSFEGPQTSFEDILERFAESWEVICVREAENSWKYGNRVIKVDFVY